MIYICQKKQYIESKIGMSVEYSFNKKDGRININSSGDMKKNQDEWNGYFQWLCEKSISLYAIIHEIDM